MKKYIALLLALCILPMGEALGKMSKAEKQLFKTLRQDFKKVKKADDATKITLLKYLCEKAPNKFWNQKIGKPFKKQTRKRNLVNHFINEMKKTDSGNYRIIALQGLKVMAAHEAFKPYHQEMQIAITKLYPSLISKIWIKRLKNIHKRRDPGFTIREIFFNEKSEQVWNEIKKPLIDAFIRTANVIIKRPEKHLNAYYGMLPKSGFNRGLDEAIRNPRLKEYHTKLKDLKKQIELAISACNLRSQYKKLLESPDVNILKHLCEKAPKEFWDKKIGTPLKKETRRKKLVNNIINKGKKRKDSKTIRHALECIKIMETCEVFAPYHQKIKSLTGKIEKKAQLKTHEQTIKKLHKRIKDSLKDIKDTSFGFPIERYSHNLVEIIWDMQSANAWKKLDKPFMRLVKAVANNFYKFPDRYGTIPSLSGLLTKLMQRPELKKHNATLQNLKNKALVVEKGKGVYDLEQRVKAQIAAAEEHRRYLEKNPIEYDERD